MVKWDLSCLFLLYTFIMYSCADMRVLLSLSTKYSCRGSFRPSRNRKSISLLELQHHCLDIMRMRPHSIFFAAFQIQLHAEVSPLMLRTGIGLFEGTEDGHHHCTMGLHSRTPHVAALALHSKIQHATASALHININVGRAMKNPCRFYIFQMGITRTTGSICSPFYFCISFRISSPYCGSLLFCFFWSTYSGLFVIHE
uniref:Uncharacterized protein n=1 Tax=Oryza brachyantha TaxID=4533 RepID=J3MZ56_ORYBR